MPNPETTATDSGGPVKRPVSGGYNISRTVPDELLRHDISNEELVMLGDMRRDYLWEGKWVALGTALGVGPESLDTLVTWLSVGESTPLSGGSLIKIVVFFVAAAIFLLLQYIMRNKTRDCGDLVRAIQERTKQKVGGEG